MMNTRTMLLAAGGFLGVVVVGSTWLARAQPGSHLDADRIGKAAGAKTTTTKDGIVRIGWPRTDVRVKVDGMPLQPFAGLGSWAAFAPAPHGAMVMGDTVVFEDEVTPAMDAAFAGGLEVTALHNHFFYDEPKVYFMHIGGRATPRNWPGPSKESGTPSRRSAPGGPVPGASSPGAFPGRGRSQRQPLKKSWGTRPRPSTGW
jgi:hypothetical protein